MGDEDRARGYLAPYREAVRAFGGGFEATLWSSRASQGVRFDVMIDMVPFDGEVILDVGCGPGDFAAHLIERGVPFAQFVGIDALPEMIDVARARGLDRSRFEMLDGVEARDLLAPRGAAAIARPDWVTFSGTLNTMDDATARDLLQRAFDVAASGIVFNFLSQRCPPAFLEKPLEPARRFDPVGFLDWALSLSPVVQFRQEYLGGHDATIAIARS